MINPTMINNNGKTEKDLWKDEPNKLRIWIILFAISLFIFSIISIIGSSLTMSNSQSLVKSFHDQYQKDYKDPKASELAQRVVLVSYIVMPFIYGILAVVSAISFINSLPKSYKEKSFANISNFSIYSSYVLGFITFISIISIYKSIPMLADHVGAILVVITSGLAIILFGCGIQVGRIKMSFLKIKRMNDLQSSPEFQQMQQQMQNFFNQANSGQTPNSPFYSTPTSASNTKNKSSTDSPADKNKEVITEESNEIKELKKMSLTDLKDIAKKLSISGLDKMSKLELIESIIRVTKNN